MKKICLSFLVLCFFVQVKAQPAAGRYLWLDELIASWGTVSRDIFKIKLSNTPQLLFFDSDSVYTTSTISAPRGIPFHGPPLAGTAMKWYKAAHSGKIVLPTGDTVPIGIMSFAAPLKTEGDQSFFVMAAPDFWQTAGVKRQGLKLNELVTGVFLHEFSHSQQLNGFGKQVSELESKYALTELSDDMLEDEYSKDSTYAAIFTRELQIFKDAVFEKDIKRSKKLALTGLTMIDKRHERYFQGSKPHYIVLDKIFLSMEGAGQFAAVSWLKHAKGGNLSFDEAVKGFSRKGGSWSQEEGLVLFLLLDRYARPDWQQVMFSTQPRDILTLLKEILRK